MQKRNRQPKSTVGPAPRANKKGWSTKFPVKAGMYWFYGDPYQGQMGMDFQENTAEAKMYLVAVRKVVNGFIATTDGQFVPTTQFDRTRQRNGYVGYWMEATLPKAPNDTLGLFAKT